MFAPQNEALMIHSHLRLVQQLTARFPLLFLEIVALLTCLVALSAAGLLVAGHVSFVTHAREGGCLRDLPAANATFVARLDVGGETFFFAPEKGLLQLSARRLESLGVAITRLELDAESCFGPLGAAWLSVRGFEVGAHNELVRGLGSGYAMGEDGVIMTLVQSRELHESAAEWAVHKALLLMLSMAIQRSVAFACSAVFSSTHTPMSIVMTLLRRGQLGEAMRMAHVTFVPLLANALILISAAFVLSELLEESSLALCFVGLHWLGTLQMIYVRTWASMFVLSKMSHHLGTLVMIYSLSLYSLGLRFELLAVVASLLCSLWFSLFVFWEIAAVQRGVISFEQVREGVFLRRLVVHPQ